MAFPSVPAYIAAPNHPCPEPFGAHALAALNGPPNSIDPQAQADACFKRARVCLRAARAARADGTQSQAVRWFRSARMLRLAAGVWRQKARDAALGMDWWNGLSEAERLRWMDIAWRSHAKAAGRISYTFEDMPSAADAWAAFKARHDGR